MDALPAVNLCYKRIKRIIQLQSSPISEEFLVGVLLEVKVHSLSMSSKQPNLSRCLMEGHTRKLSMVFNIIEIIVRPQIFGKYGFKEVLAFNTKTLLLDIPLRGLRTKTTLAFFVICEGLHGE